MRGKGNRVYAGGRFIYPPLQQFKQLISFLGHDLGVPGSSNHAEIHSAETR